MNKNILIIGIIFMFIGLTILPSISSTNIDTPQILGISKTVIQVDNEGDGDYTRIQDAIDNATVGDIIEVYSGIYVEDVLINKSLNLYGIDYELGSGDDDGMPMVRNKDTETIFTVTADGCNISGFDFHYTSGYTHEGILIYESDYNNIFGNSVRGNFGVHLQKSNNNNVFDNVIGGCNTAISLYDHSNYNKIYQNDISRGVISQGMNLHYHSDYNLVFKNIINGAGGQGIKHWKSENNTIFENIISCCDTGIGIGWEDGYGKNWNVFGNQISNCRNGIGISSKYHKIYRNNISNCEYGISTDRISFTYSSHHLDIYENNIKNCDNSGIYLKGVFVSNIYRNNITSNRFGMTIWESGRNNIFENNIKYNERIGMWVWYSEGDSLIYHNNFVNLDRNVEVIRGGWPDTWNLGYTNDGGGNYWSDYKGKDRNGDGIGDTPYVILDDDYIPFNNEKDMYPLMEPDGRPDYIVRTLPMIGFIERYFERFPNTFPLLQKLLLLMK